MADQRLILKVNDVADYVDMHRDTVVRALESGELHGMQKRPGTHWRVRTACVDAWLSGQPCDHQARGAA